MGYTVIQSDSFLTFLMLVGPFQWTPICHEHSHRLSRQVFSWQSWTLLSQNRVGYTNFQHAHALDSCQKVPAHFIQPFLIFLILLRAEVSEISRLLAGDCQRSQRLSWADLAISGYQHDIAVSMPSSTRQSSQRITAVSFQNLLHRRWP